MVHHDFARPEVRRAEAPGGKHHPRKVGDARLPVLHPLPLPQAPRGRREPGGRRVLQPREPPRRGGQQPAPKRPEAVHLHPFGRPRAGNPARREGKPRLLPHPLVLPRPQPQQAHRIRRGDGAVHRRLLRPAHQLRGVALHGEHRGKRRGGAQRHPVQGLQGPRLRGAAGQERLLAHRGHPRAAGRDVPAPALAPPRRRALRAENGRPRGAREQPLPLHRGRAAPASRHPVAPHGGPPHGKVGQKGRRHARLPLQLPLPYLRLRRDAPQVPRPDAALRRPPGRPLRRFRAVGKGEGGAGGHRGTSQEQDERVGARVPAGRALYRHPRGNVPPRSDGVFQRAGKDVRGAEGSGGGDGSKHCLKFNATLSYYNIFISNSLLRENKLHFIAH